MIAAIIQARMGSKRLPGKILAGICGKPLLAHVIERIRPSRKVSQIVVATTDRREDEKILDLARQHGTVGFAGSADDVLDRYYHASRLVSADIIVRVTADDPFRDPTVMDRVIEAFTEETDMDYVKTDATYPEGGGCEAFTIDALEIAWRQAGIPSEREHVIPFIQKHPELFKTHTIKGDHDLSQYRWTVDYPVDLAFTREIYGRLYRGEVFGMDEIVALLEKEPGLCDINSGIARDEGYAWSLEQDAALLNRP